jgi:hypothetical protein
MRQSWRHHLIAAVLGTVVLVGAVACGDVTEDDLVAPDGSTIVIDPSGWTRTLAAAGSCSAYSEGPTFNVTVRNEDEEPLNDIQVEISRSNMNIAFYNTDGVTGDPAVSRITRVTDDNGTLRFKIAILDCASVTVITATSGTALAAIDVTVEGP